MRPVRAEQLQLWRGASPLESALKRAIVQWAELHPRLIRLARTPAGCWRVWGPGSPEPGEEGASGVLPGLEALRAFQEAGKRRRPYWLKGAPEGWPDLSGFVPAGLPQRSGCAVLVEVKRDRRQKPTPAQAENLSAVVEAGGVGILAWALDQFIAEYLEAVGLPPA